MPRADATPGPAEPGSTIALEPGDELFREGDAGEVLYVIASGMVRLSKMVEGREIVVAELGEGDFAGEVGAIGASVHGVTATAVAATRCLAVDLPALEAMVAESPEIRVRLMRAMAQRIGAAQRLVGVVARRDPRTRIALAIARLAEVSERDAEGAFIPKRMRDIGAEVGVDEEELGEVSKLLMRSKLIRIKRNGILVPDVPRMYEFVKSTDSGIEFQAEQA